MSEIPLTEDPLVKTTRCMVPEALADDPSRIVIWRACRQFFDNTRTTPLELLYATRHQEALMSAGSAFLGANQKVAIAQVGGTKQSVSDRLKELNALTMEWQKLTRAYEARSAAVARPGELHALMAGLEGNAAEREAMTRIAIARMLFQFRDYAKKFDAVMELEPEPDPEAAEILDAHVGELLRTQAVAEQLMQDAATLEARLHRLADFVAGIGEAPSGLSPTMTRLATWLLTRPMPNARAALEGNLLAQIAAGQPLTKGPAPVELKAVLDLRKRLTSNGQVLGGEATSAAFDRRCGRLINPDAIDKLIGRTASPLAELEAVLPFLAEPIGERARDYIGTMIDQTIQACPTINRLIGEENAPPPKRLKALARFHKSIGEAGLSGAITNRVLRAVEGLHAEALKDGDPLARIETQAGSNAEKAIALLDLCRSGMLLPGDYLKRARKAAETRLKAPDFMAAYLADAAEPAQRARKIENLKSVLIEAGIGL